MSFQALKKAAIEGSVARKCGDHEAAERAIGRGAKRVNHGDPEHTDLTVRIMRRPEVEAATGMKRSTLYKAMADRRFPSPVRVGPNAVGWRSDEVAAWIADLPRAEVA